MKVTLQSHVNSDGTLIVRVPAELNNCDVTVTIETHQPPKTPEELGWPPGFFEQTFGSLPDLERLPQGELPQREPLE